MQKNKMASNDSKMSNSARNGKRIRRQMAVLGGSGGFTAVSSSSLINIIKATARPKHTAVTHILAKLLR